MLKKTILLFLFTTISLSLMAKEFYRYKNAEGKVVIVYQVNNEMVLLGYDVLNENGLLVKKVKPGKTLEEEEQARIDKIDEKRNQYLLQQKIRNDAELLRQFDSVGDIIRNRDGQLLGLEQRIRIQYSKSALLKLQLEDQQKQAAIHERLGQKIPKLLQNDIDATQNQIIDNTNNALLLEEQKVIIASRFEGDIIRYKELESLRARLKKTESTEGAELTGVTYECQNEIDCQKAWQLAQIYANEKASGRIEIITNALILTSKAEKDTDFALSFSKIPLPNNTSQIVFEVSCANTELGAKLCKSEKANNLRVDYLTLVEKQLPLKQNNSNN